MSTTQSRPDPSSDARLESLAEAVGVYLPDYEASLPPHMQYAEPAADQAHLDRVQADYLADDGMFRDLAPLPDVDLEVESDADRAAAAAWDEWQADLAEDARIEGREATP